MNNDDVVYMLGSDETVLTRDIDGVVEHKHTGFNYWHPVSRMHNGCGRTDSGVDSDVRICAVCDCNDHASMCHTRRRQLGLTTGFVEHYVSGMERTTNEGVVEHIHDEYMKWHFVNILHFGCRRVENGEVLDSIMCGKCQCFDDSGMCIGMRKMRGMNVRDYFSHDSFAISDKRPKVVDGTDTLLMIDEAVAELVSAKSMIASIGEVSTHVKHAKFEQFVNTIDVIVGDLLKISSLTEEEMEAARNAKTTV